MSDSIGCWEVVADPDRVMYRVRWSVPDEDGAHLYVRHYPFAFNHSAYSEAKRFNEEGRRPEEWDVYRPRKDQHE